MIIDVMNLTLGNFTNFISCIFPKYGEVFYDINTAQRQKLCNSIQKKEFRIYVRKTRSTSYTLLQ